MDMIKPPKLSPGDKIAAVSLSWGGPSLFPQRYLAGKRQLENALGLNLLGTPLSLLDAQFIHENPKRRAEDLMMAFADPSIRGIFSTIGGDDSIRLLPYLDLDLIRDHPKVFLGFSDTTITHFSCFQVGLVSFYGPSIMTGFAENGGMFPYTINSLKKTLFSSEVIGRVPQNPDTWTVERLEWGNRDNQERLRKREEHMDWRWLQGKGVVQGPLIGGCLEVIDWLRGTRAWPDLSRWENAILFLETSEDAPPPAAVTFFLRCLATMGVLERLSGILFGRPGGGIPIQDFVKYDQALLEVISRENGLENMPIITRMDFGHTDPTFLLPYGVTAEIDCDQKQFSILENAVADGETHEN